MLARSICWYKAAVSLGFIGVWFGQGRPYWAVLNCSFVDRCLSLALRFGVADAHVVDSSHRGSGIQSGQYPRVACILINHNAYVNVVKKNNL